jgi:LmbE family N-acetylglucosaminyl deacetylase
MAGGVLRQALDAGKRAAVLVLTNGDYTCARSGAVRQAETVAALGDIGLPESQVYFFGYADGFLSKLSEVPLTVKRLMPDGQCQTASTTWANRGASGMDVHRARTGVSARLIRSSVSEDLSAVLQQLRPRDIYLPHESDVHADHAAAYRLVKEALPVSRSHTVVLHRSVVHTRDECWPSDCKTTYLPHQPMALPAAPFVPKNVQRVAIDGAQKLKWIGHFVSQLDAPLEQDWLAGFARSDELFFLEFL